MTHDKENKDRAERARIALEAMPGSDEWDLDVNIIDLMANLLHLADQEGHNAEWIARMATCHYNEERITHPCDP